MAKNFKNLWYGQLDNKPAYLKEVQFIKSVGDVLWDLSRVIDEYPDNPTRSEWANSGLTSYDIDTALKRIGRVVKHYNEIFHIVDTTLSHAEDAEKKGY